MQPRRMTPSRLVGFVADSRPSSRARRLAMSVNDLKVCGSQQAKSLKDFRFRSIFDLANDSRRVSGAMSCCKQPALILVSHN